MGGTFSRIKTWVTGETLTAAQINAEFDNILDNLDPTGIDDESATDGAAQATSDPYSGSSLTKATSLEVEIQQLRYLIKQITGETYWYIDPDFAIADITATAAEINKACDGVTATAAEINKAADGIVYAPITADATAGKVLRSSRIVIQDATAAAEIKCTTYSLWNGDAIAATDNIGKGETVGNFTLDATGSYLKIEAAGLTGNCVAVLSAVLVNNASQTAILVRGIMGGNDIDLTFTNATTAATVDLTTLVDTGIMTVYITYLTDA